MREALPGHIVHVKYRCDKNHQYPVPVHDVLTAYDWIINNLLPRRAITRPGRSEVVGRLAVCGELLGGSLATALAFSECRIGEPGIVAAAVQNPIVDWTSLHGQSRMPLTRQQMVAESTGLTWGSLMKHRDVLFRKPDHYFDTFASPILLFRSAGLEVPAHIEEKPLDEMEELIRFEREESLREQLAAGAEPDMVEPEEQPIARTRKVSRRFPSKFLGLQLPHFRIESGSDAMISGQATELAHQLRQSFERQRKAKVSSSRFTHFDDGVKLDPADDPVRHLWSPGLGLWDDGKLGKALMLDTAKWLRHRLAV